MKTLGRDTFQFMADLWENNTKAWFDENRKHYEDSVRKPLKAVAAGLSDPIAAIVPEFDGKPKISRINNDIRFTPNKPPYKEHMCISYGAKGSIAELFTAIGRNGWAVGCAVSSNKRDPLDGWRKNLLDNAERWRNYLALLPKEEIPEFYYGNIYKKPLFPDIPEDIKDLVQCKGVWIVQKARLDFKATPEQDLFRGICIMLPIFILMAVPPFGVKERLAELGKKISPPEKGVGEMWKVW
ncbi:MAG: DUF2461 domain-containing protein [Calditrichaeota bacterium]|nr:DUF2461 domain-containing protein [Calditrichota bacterium]